MRMPKVARAVGAVLVATLLCSAASQAQTPPPGGEAALSADFLRGELDRVQMAAELDPTTRAAVVERYKSALLELARLGELRASGERLRHEAAGAAEEVAGLHAERDRLIKSAPEQFPGGSLADAERELAAREARLAILRQEWADVAEQRKNRANQRAAIRRTQESAGRTRAELQRLIDQPPAETEAAEQTIARRIEARCKLETLKRAVDVGELELAVLAAEEQTGLLDLRAEVKTLELKREEAFVAALKELITGLREAEARRQVEEATEQKLLAHPLLLRLAEQNRASAEAFARFPSSTAEVRGETERVEEETERLRRRRLDIEDKVSKVGLTRSIGERLRDERSRFPDLAELDDSLEKRQEAIDAARLESWQYADELANLPEAPEYVRSVVSEGLTAEHRMELERAAGELLATRQRLLGSLQQASDEFREALEALDYADQVYLRESGRYLHYINERILWTRSADPLSVDLLRQDAKERKWLFSVTNWRSVGAAIAADPLEHPFAFWPTLAAIAALFYVRLSIRPRLRSLGADALKRGFLRYGPTWQAAVLTGMSAATAPAGLLFVSWRLAEADDPHGFVRAVAAALELCAALLLPIELVRESCRHLGLAEAHFAWPARATGHLRHVLTWLKTAGLPVTFLAALAHEHVPLSGGTPTERLLFVGGMSLAAVTLHRLLSKHGELAKALAAEQPSGLLARFRRGWYAVAVAIPVLLGGLSAFGFHYSATQVAHRLLWTLWLAAVLVLVRAMAVRWVVLSRRRLLLDQAYQRRAAEQADDGDGKPPIVEETDVAKSTAQTRKLVDLVVLGFSAVFLVMIWADTLPAFGLLDRPVWTVADSGGQSPVSPGLPVPGEASPAAEPPAADRPAEIVTTGDLAAAILVALFTVLASRNLPGLMEMSLLARLPVDHATRYAATRLGSYAIGIVGVLMASNMIGLRWQNVQWLVAALTVGLGFGLQEVFANFVSGLIILFERPIRVGDVVTIDNVSGSVARIRMRATTIVNWDRKEFIVPNKEFITGRVLNWTLSDSVNRVTINVGIAYGSDVDQAREILLRVCREQPAVLNDPPPTAALEGFGESSLNLVLRCFLPSLESRTDVSHELHRRIDLELRSAGIDLAFPQRDLHIRSVQGLTLSFAGSAAPGTLDFGTVERAAG